MLTQRRAGAASLAAPPAREGGATAYRATIDAIRAEGLAALEQRGAADLELLPAAEREELRVKLNLGVRAAQLMQRSRCGYCFHPKCICELVSRPRALRHRLWVWIHHSDLFRASNSGKLLALSCPDARLAVAGLPATEAELLGLLAERRATTCVVYPAKDSRSTREYVEWLRAQPGAPGGATGGAGPPALDIVVIDGTWTQVKSTVRRLPAQLHFVRVNLACAPSLFSARHQGRERQELGFTSTLEACAALLDELGEERSVSAALRDSFKLNDDTVLLYKRGEAAQAYGSWARRRDGALVPLVLEMGGYLD